MAVPTVTTQAVTAIITATATGNGNVTADGGATVTDRGVCWALTTNPVVGGLHAHAVAGGTGAFTGALTGLSLGTLYYLRAFATNADGTAYGANVTFYTAPAVAQQQILIRGRERTANH
jgi:hypothetical protein